jgi:hypothetical protein
MKSFSFFSCAGLAIAALFSTAVVVPAADRFIAPSEPDAGNLRTLVELVRKDVRTEKALILAQNIDFTKDEAVDFWPLYNEYELELTKWYDQRFTLVKGYFDRHATMTDDQTTKLADDVFSLEEKRTDLKRKYYKKFSKIVGPKKSARFFQIENQLNSLIDMRIAAEVPLIK